MYKNLEVVIEPYLFNWDQIKRIEENKNAKYVCCVEYKNAPCELFFTDKIHPVSQSQYFIIFMVGKRIMIGDGSPLDSFIISGYKTGNKIVYSRFGHDFKSHGGITVDGGPKYGRVLFVDDDPPAMARLIITKGKLVPFEINEFKK